MVRLAKVLYLSFLLNISVVFPEDSQGTDLHTRDLKGDHVYGCLVQFDRSGKFDFLDIAHSLGQETHGL